MTAFWKISLMSYVKSILTIKALVHLLKYFTEFLMVRVGTQEPVLGMQY